MAGLYIHIPLCASKCAYCDFYSVAGGTINSPGTLRTPGAYEKLVAALKREMSFRRDFTGGEPLDTIYTGGGTPTQLSTVELHSLTRHAAGLWDVSSLCEVTLETNPEDLTDDYIGRLSETDCNRLSIGIQSFDDGLLRLMNRRHNARRAKDAVGAAQKAGFDNISVDLIFGIPTMSTRQWERSLDEALGLGVQHISAYHLTIEPETHFGRMARNGTLAPIPEVDSERQYEILCRKLSDAGFEHYEISNFALSGWRAVHNSAYWSGAPYLGIGPSAHSFDGKRRREWVAPDIEKYIAEAGTSTVYEGETLSDTEIDNEKIMISLRTADGLDLDEIGTVKKNALLRRAQKFLADGLLVRQKNRIVIPSEKFLLSDYVIGTLFDS